MTTKTDGAVCECGHEIHNGRCQYWKCNKDHVDCYNCPCEQFTDARIAALRARVEELERQVSGWGSAAAKYQLDCGILGDEVTKLERIVAQRDAEIARLTPTATRDLPTREGWYHYAPLTGPGVGNDYIVRVGTAEGRLCMLPSEEPLILIGPGYWSRDPIPEMTIEKEGENI